MALCALPFCRGAVAVTLAALPRPPRGWQRDVGKHKQRGAACPGNHDHEEGRARRGGRRPATTARAGPKSRSEREKRTQSAPTCRRALVADRAHVWCPRMSGVMVDLVSTVKQLSDSPDNLRQLLSTLQQREDQLIQMLPQLDDAMQALTPSQHTLGLIFILCVRPPPSRQALHAAAAPSSSFVPGRPKRLFDHTRPHGQTLPPPLPSSSWKENGRALLLHAKH